MSGNALVFHMFLLTINSNSRIPDMKKATAIIVPPTTILCKGFFKRFNLKNKDVKQIKKSPYL